VKSARRGQDFDVFFREIYPRACRATRRVSRDESAAEDAALEAMTRAFVRWPRLRSLPYPDAWVLRVAINEALGELRRAGRKSAPVRLVSSDGSDVLEDVVTTGLALAAALRQLPRRQREAIELRYLADFSEDDTAAALGLSNGAVKSHLHRAAKSLRLVLGNDLMEELNDVRP
jgi:RNA polymerase sigma-70 factor (ECF subfamily)